MKPSFSLFVPAIALGVLFSFSPAASGFGGPPGGPFSNGSYFPNDGTFSAVIRGENLSGVLQFSTTGGAGASSELLLRDDEGGVTIAETGRGVGSTGVATIYYDGDTFLGNSQGAYNPVDSTMSVNFQASSPGQGENEYFQQQPVPNPADGVPAYQNTSEFLYFDSLYFNGFADCKTSNSFPNQKFTGIGEAEFQYLALDNTKNYTGEPDFTAVRVPLSVTGVRLSNVSSAFSTRDVRPPSFNRLSILQQ